MEILAAFGLDSALYILWVALGLGLVIFFHELGHFAVAKWCNVNVERFSIGFGPILWRFKHGETEYALSAVPFGGYVKMLGQDDLDPSQLSSEEIAQDSRSYSAKPVSYRMAIISAGVIMNVVTGLLFYIGAFRLGVVTSPAVVGSVRVDMPAWHAGLETGDEITRINDRDVESFGDILLGVALSQGPLTIEGRKSSGEKFNVTLEPEKTGKRRMIGVGQAAGVQLIRPTDEDILPVNPGTPAAVANPEFRRGDAVKAVEGQDVSEYSEVLAILAERRTERIEFSVQRDGQSESDQFVEVVVEPNPFRTLGLSMDIGRISAVRGGSVAEEAGLKIGDKITKFQGQDVGKSINPLRLPDQIAELHGQTVELTVTRELKDGGTEDITVHVTPENRPSWIDQPADENLPMSVPSMGIAFHVIPTVLHVQPGSPAEGAVQVGDRIKLMELIRPQDVPRDGTKKETFDVEFSDEKKNWPYAFWLMQNLPLRKVRLTVSRDAKVLAPIELTPQAANDWYMPTRGIRWAGLAKTQKAETLPDAAALGWKHTRNSMLNIYLTLRNLVTGQLSVKNLHGPLGIATFAYEVAQEGLSQFLLFLGFLSVNLAVLNFLPIPVLDGGHMVFLCWEAATRKKPSERVLVAATYLGFAFVAGLMILVLYLDIFEHGLLGN